MYACIQCGARFRSGTRYCQECGARLFAIAAPPRPEWEDRPKGLVTALPVGCGIPRRKNVSVAVALSALFGPLGLLYSSVSGALYMLLVWCFLVLATCDDWISNDVLLPVLIAWPLCVAWGALAARAHNEDLR